MTGEVQLTLVKISSHSWFNFGLRHTLKFLLYPSPCKPKKLSGYKPHWIYLCTLWTTFAFAINVIILNKYIVEHLTFSCLIKYYLRNFLVFSWYRTTTKKAIFFHSQLSLVTCSDIFNANNI